MSTVGLSFGSATSGTGFDVATTVTAIQAAESGIEAPWNTQLTALKAQDAVFTSLGADLSTLTTALQNLSNFDGVLSEKQGASSDTSLLALTSASSAATAGSHTVIVSTLAQTSSEFSDTVKSTTDTLTGSVTINGTVITIDSTSDTLSTLAAAINTASAGVTASVITDRSGSRLSLLSTTGGAAGQIALSGSLTDATTGTAIAFNTGNPGQDAVFTVDGIKLTSASNTITDAISGLTFQLLAADPNTTVQVQITNNTTDVGAAVASLVTAYNAVLKDITTQEGNDATGAAEPLFGSPALASIQGALTSALFGGSASGSINSLTQLGISVGTNGTLSLNTDTLQSELTTNYADVTGFLQNSGSFGQTFATTLNNLGAQAPSGAVYLALQQNSQVETNLNQNLTTENALLAAQKISLTNELNTANQILQSIPAQLNEINEIYSAVTGFNTK